MKTYALTYWFTWAFLVIAAALTGVASLKGAFFGGLFASGLSALLTRTYVRAGARYAPLLGATAGTLWVVAMCAPCINYIFVLVLSQKATNFLQANGVKVGFFGADPSKLP